MSISAIARNEFMRVSPFFKLRRGSRDEETDYAGVFYERDKGCTRGSVGSKAWRGYIGRAAPRTLGMPGVFTKLEPLETGASRLRRIAVGSILIRCQGGVYRAHTFDPSEIDVAPRGRRVRRDARFQWITLKSTNFSRHGSVFSKLFVYWIFRCIIRRRKHDLKY